MEKAKLQISQGKNGKVIVGVVFVDSGKPMTIQNCTRQNIQSLNGKEVEVEREGGQIVKVILQGEVLFSKAQTTSHIHTGARGQGGNPQRTNLAQPAAAPSAATAPYNFVPLHTAVVSAETSPGADSCTFDRYHDGKRTGHIELVIATKTPLYIRDTLTKEEMATKEELEKDGKKKYINPNFFSPGGGNVCIPGSSLRGMARAMVEMVSFSKLGFFEGDRKYHFRSFVDKALDLRKKYVDKMLSGNDLTGYSQQVQAGYLVKEGMEFKIKPAQKNSHGCRYYRVEEDLVISNGVLSERMNRINAKGEYEANPKYSFDFAQVRFTYNPPKRHKRSVGMYYAEVTDICKISNHLAYSTEGALIHSGWMGGPRYRNNGRGKHLHWVIGPPSNTKLEFLPSVIEDYRNDKDRHEEANLLRHFENPQIAEVPCFYVEESGKVKSFGHTGLFRLAYERKLNDFLPDEMQKFQETKKIDIAEAIFGNIENETTLAGRVFFECAEFGAGREDVPQKEDIPCVLSNPKPTTFQHYLKQGKVTPEFKDDGSIRGYKGIKNYNDVATLRGNKLYWHRKGDTWQESTLSFPADKFNELLREHGLQERDFSQYVRTDKQKREINVQSLPENLKLAILKCIGIYDTQHTKIKPVAANKTFTGKIRFENLSDVELGALLFALDLPDNCCHKLGMGKPLGLGTVKITPKLFLSDRKTRYTRLLAEWDAAIPESTAKDKDIPHFKKQFAVYVLNKLKITPGAEPVNTLWGVDRMKELKTMLVFDKERSDEKTRYMTITPINEFKERRVLPNPTEVYSLV
ncbi:MAG: superfamily protein [Candidatus Brocadiaceae bacterium]|nr:superfamily protein [Candidatus Brocadiaceae bacterium]